MDIRHFYIEKGNKEAARLKAEMFGLMVNEPNVHSDELAAIRAKTLVIAGTNAIIKREHTQLIAARIANADLVWIRGNHFIAARQPKEFNRAVLKFLREDERKRWSDL